MRRGLAVGACRIAVSSWNSVASVLFSSQQRAIRGDNLGGRVAQALPFQGAFQAAQGPPRGPRRPGREAMLLAVLLFSVSAHDRSGGQAACQGLSC